MPSAKDIFLDALDLPDADRDAFVEQACGADAALRRRVDELLATHRRNAGRLDTPAAMAIEPACADPASSLRPGDMIGRYRLERQLGEGGFGAVWLARQTEPVDRVVAIKVLKSDFSSPQVVKRFESERQALAMMDHPNVARVFDAGETESGRPYFVMEYVDGLAITEFADRHKLDLRERLELFERACLAVQHAHAKGIIHRDLKPGNILVAEIDGTPQPKVIDFGIARAADPEAGVLPSMTREFQIIGTPQYMSPEQAVQGSSAVDTRSDIYSLGTVLYELIAGAPPFDPLVLRRAGLEEVLRIIREQTPVRPSTRIVDAGDIGWTVAGTRSTEPTRLKRLIAGEVDWIVMKSLEKDPARRYQTASDLAADIRRHLSNQPVSAGPPSPLYAAKKFAMRHRVEMLAASMVVVMLVAAAVWSTISAAEAREAQLAAEASEEVARQAEAMAIRSAQQSAADARDARRELLRSLAMSKFTSNILKGIDPAIARGRDTTLLMEILADAERRIPEQLEDEPAVEMMVRQMLGSAYLQVGRRDLALAQLERAYALARDKVGLDDHESLVTSTSFGNALLDADRFSEAEEVLTTVVQSLERQQLVNTSTYLAALSNLGAVYLETNNLTGARDVFAEVLEGRRRLTPDDPLTLTAVNNLAAAERRLGRLEEARVMWEELVELQREQLGEDHVATLGTMNNLATLYSVMGRESDSLTLHEQVVAVRRRVLPVGHPALVRSLQNYGTQLVRLNRIDEGAAAIEEALESSRDTLKPDDQQTLAMLIHLANARRKQGRYDEAIELAERAHEGMLSKFATDDPRSLSALTVRSATLADAGRFQEALEQLQAGGYPLPEFQQPDLRRSFHILASRALLGVDRPADARASLEAARAITSPPLGAGEADRIGEIDAQLRAGGH